MFHWDHHLSKVKNKVVHFEENAEAHLFRSADGLLNEYSMITQRVIMIIVSCSAYGNQEMEVLTGVQTFLKFPFEIQTLDCSTINR